MTPSLANRTIMIVEGRSISTFRLRKDLEQIGAIVCVSRLADAELAVRNARPDAVVIDFSIAPSFDGIDALEQQAIPHMVCRSPNKFQDLDEQVAASSHVASALAELLVGTEPLPDWLGLKPDLDPELYAI